VGIEKGGLLRNRIDNPRMTVSDMRHVVIHIEVPATVLGIQPYPFAPDEVQRVVIK
jgi:hypothetical protein